MSQNSPDTSENRTVKLSTEQWTEAQRRTAVIDQLAKDTTETNIANAAQTLGLARRTIYYLLKRWKESNGRPEALVSKGPRVDIGKSRLTEKVDTIVTGVLHK